MNETVNKGREELINIVHNYIDRHPKVDPAYTWGRVYRMVGNEYRQNIFKEAKRRKVRIIDYLEQENMINAACHIANIILSGDKK